MVSVRGRKVCLLVFELRKDLNFEMFIGAPASHFVSAYRLGSFPQIPLAAAPVLTCF